MERGSHTWKIATAIIAVLVVTATFTVAFTDNNPSDDGESSDEGKTIIDLSIKNNRTGEYAYSTCAPSFTVRFPSKTNDTFLCRVITEDGNISYYLSDIKPESGDKMNRSDVLGVKDRCLMTYDDLIDGKLDLDFKVALNGIKETLVLKERINSTNDLEIRTRIMFDDAGFTAWIGKKKVGIIPIRTGDSIEIHNAENVSVFKIPPPFAYDSRNGNRTRTPVIEEYSLENGTSRCSYKVSMIPAGMELGVVVPSVFLDAKSTMYPVYIDPTLDPIIAGETYYSNDDVYVYSDVNILPEGLLSLTNCNLIFGDGPFTLNVENDGVLELQATDIYHENSGEPYYVNINGQITVDGGSMDQPAEGLVISSDDSVDIEDFSIMSSGGNGISISSTQEPVFINGTLINSSTLSGIDISSTFETVSINGCELNGGSSGISISESEANIVNTDFHSITEYGVDIEGPGSDVDIINSDFSDVNVAVSSFEASVTMNHCTMTGGTTGVESSSSTVNMQVCEFSQFEYGISSFQSTLTSSGGFITGSDVGVNSQQDHINFSGLSLTDLGQAGSVSQPNHLDLQGLIVTLCDFPLGLSSVTEGYISNSLFTDNGDGINVTGSTLSIWNTNFLENTGTGLISSTSTIKTRQCTFDDNDEGVNCTDPAQRFEFINCKFKDNEIGAYLSNGEFLLDNPTFINCSSWNVVANSATLDIIAYYFPDWKYYRDQTTTIMRKELNLTLVNENGTVKDNVKMTVYDADGQVAGDVNATPYQNIWNDANGQWSRLQLVQYIEDSNGSRNFKTPHNVILINSTSSSGPYNSKLVMDAYKDYTLTWNYTVSDLDDDGVPDQDTAVSARNCEPEDNVTWFEAEHHNTSTSYPQEELIAFEGTAINGTALLQPNTFAEFLEGYYRIVLRARGVVDGAAMVLVVHDKNGIELLSPQRFILKREAYNWFASDEIHLDQNGVLQIYLNSTTTGQVLLDKLAVVKVKDAAGTPTGELPGYITDPLVQDSDDDLANDSVERSPTSSWLEVEHLTSNPRHEDGNASSSTAVGHENGTNHLLEYNVSKQRYTIDGQEKIQFYLKARKNVSSAAQIAINVTYNGTTYSTTHSLDDFYDWFQSDAITLIDGVDTITVRVFDLNDTNLADSTDFVLLDKLHVRDPDTDPVPTFYASDPMDYDTDSDSLSDGYEIFGLFKVDKIEAEECILGPGVIVRDGLIFLNETNSTDGNFFSTILNMSEPGFYSIHVDYGISIPYGGLNLPLVGHLMRLQVQNHTAPEQKFFSINEYNTSMAATELYPQGGQGNISEDLFSTKDFHYKMTSGSYDLYFDLDPTVALIVGTVNFTVWADNIVIMRRTLAPLDSDADDDDAWDGLEFEGNSFPLNVDTDHDTIWDGEEYFTGADGWITSPISNDTDTDGILDQIEIGSVLSLDPTDMDTDGDELPDGWIDGWLYHPEEGKYIINELLKDGFRQPWEGEDLDGSGVNKTGDLDLGTHMESIGGETNPTNPDTDGDGMPDGWELRFRGQTEGGYPCMLDPLHNDSWLDKDSDRLNNSQEHNFDTNPFLNDTDLDTIDDGNETKVSLRTNITDGMVSSDHYSSASEEDWIVYNPNPYIASLADVYKYHHNTTCFVAQDREFDCGLEGGEPTLLLEDNEDFSSHATGAVFNLSDQGDLWSTEGVLPIYGSNILRFNGTDSSNSSDSHISLKIYDFGTPLTVTEDMHLAFWMYVKTSSGGLGHVGVDGRITSGYLSDPAYNITGLYGEALNVTNRTIVDGIWLLFDYNLSSVAGQDLSYICVVYDDDNVMEVGVFRAYFDNIRLYEEFTPPYDQESDGVRFLHAMTDGSSVIYNSTLDRIYVIANGTEIVDRNDDGLLNGTVYVFTTFEGVPDASIKRGGSPDIRFKGREALGGIDPFRKDSDRDGIMDGRDGALNGSVYDWWGDIDNDGFASAMDTDSDNDTILDCIEDLDRDGVFDPLGNETVPYLADTDGDGTPDNLDPLPLDFDNDGLTGFLVHDGYAFDFGSLEDIWGTTFNDPDTDGDGLLDGEEDANRDGEYDPVNETHPLDLDTDDDGLWDGYNNLSTPATNWEFVKIEAEDYSYSNRNCTIENGTASGGEMVEFWTDDLYEYTVEASGTPSGNQLRTGTYEIMARIQDNCTEEYIADHNPKNVSLYLDGTGMDEILVHVMPYYMFDAPNGTWSVLYVGMVNLTVAQTYTIRLENGWRDVGDDGEKFFLDYINLTRIKYFGEVRIGTDPTRNDTDGDHVQDGTEWGLVDNVLSIMNDTNALEMGTNTSFFVPDSDPATATDPLNVDSDGDGLYDGWCDINGSGNFEGNDTGEDIDCDGATGAGETDPLDADTDDDGLSDLFEMIWGTEPLDRDSDGDNVSDGTELGVVQPLPDTDIYATTEGFYHFVADNDTSTTTDPLNWDTDGDSLPDGWIDYNEDGEFNWSEGEDFNLSGRHNVSGVVEKYHNSTGWFEESNPLTNDSDSDMLKDSDEPIWGCDPNDPDSDGDNLLDGWEVYVYSTDPNCSDTDQDTLRDDHEIQNGSNPNCPDSDSDGLPDGLEVNWSDDSDLDGYINAMDPDSDNDGLGDAEEETNTTTAGEFVPTIDGFGDATNMTNADTDGDGINDTYDAYPLDFDNDKLSGFMDFPGEEVVQGTNYTLADSDYDGLSDWDELNTYSTLPLDNDTDNDGLLDGVEVRGWYIYFLDEFGNVSHSRHVTSDPGSTDADGDGMTDLQEFMVSNATSVDTDSDGLTDDVDDDNSTVEHVSPEISNITLRVNITKDGWGPLSLRHYYLQVIVDATDNAGIQWVNVTFLDSGVTVTCTNWTDGNVYYAQFSSSKDQLADGFEVRVSVTDVNDYTVFRVEEGDFDTGWEKLWETLTAWIDAAVTYIREVAAAFLALLVGPVVAGAIQGFIEGFAKAMFDDLSFIAQIPGMIASLSDMVAGIGAMVGNLGLMLKEMINSTIQKVKKIAPYPGTVDVGMVGSIVMRFLTGDWSFEASDLALFCTAYVVMSIVGAIIWMVISGSVMAKIGKILKGTELAESLGNGMNRIKKVVEELKGPVSKSDDVARTSVRAADEGKIISKGFSRGTAKAATEPVDDVMKKADNVVGNAIEDVAADSRKAFGKGRLTSGYSDDVIRRLKNRDAIEDFLGDFSHKELWNDDTLLALDKVFGKYADDAKRMEKLKILAERSDMIDGSGIQTFMKSWGNSIGTGSKGIDGYAAQFDEITAQLDNLPTSSSKRMVVGERVPVGDRKVELDIQIKEKVGDDIRIEATEIKTGDVSLTTHQYGTLDQITRQSQWLKEASDGSVLRWKFEGDYSKSVLDELKNIKHPGKTVEVFNKKGELIYSYTHPK